MKRVAFVQVDSHGQPYSPAGAAAARGFSDLGYRVAYFSPSELEQVLEEGSVVVGGSGSTRRALRLLGAQVPPPLNLPKELEPFWGRRLWQATLGELEGGPFPVFAKPLEESKVFQGQVFQRAEDVAALYLLRPGFPTLSSDSPCQAQQVVRFLSEWRAFVIRGQVQGLSHYAGDPLLFPAAPVIRMAIAAYSQGPSGYAADFGVTRDGRTLLVEVNDGISLGNGGLPAQTYARLLETRWRELTNFPA